MGQRKTGAAGAALLERDAELRVLEAAVTRAGAGEGSVVVVRGGAGIGKTALLRRLADLASATGMRVLSARGTELERPFPFGVARQLFERVAADESSPGTCSRARPSSPNGSSSRPAAGANRRDDRRDDGRLYGWVHRWVHGRRRRKHRHRRDPILWLRNPLPDRAAPPGADRVAIAQLLGRARSNLSGHNHPDTQRVHPRRTIDSSRCAAGGAENQAANAGHTAIASAGVWRSGAPGCTPGGSERSRGRAVRDLRTDGGVKRAVGGPGWWFASATRNEAPDPTRATARPPRRPRPRSPPAAARDGSWWGWWR